MGTNRNSGFNTSTTSIGEGIVLTDLAFNPIAFDSGAAAMFSLGAQQGENETAAFLLPEEIQQAFRNGGSSVLSGEQMCFPVGKSSYMCRAYLLEPESGSCAQPMVVIHLQEESRVHKDSASEAIHHVAAEYELTEREREALVYIAMGLSSKEVAARMKISPNTVKSFLRLIMIKMGVERRGAIITKLLEYNGTHLNANQS